jgi:hypothetical protein
VRVKAASVTILVALAGCGGGGAAPKHQPEQRGGEETERPEAVKGVPRRDLTAFYQVALAAGQLRQWGASGGKQGRGELKAARARLRDLEPASTSLARARGYAEGAVDDALAGGRPRAALAGADHLRALIDRIVRSDPRLGALMPD